MCSELGRRGFRTSTQNSRCLMYWRWFLKHLSAAFGQYGRTSPKRFLQKCTTRCSRINDLTQIASCTAETSARALPALSNQRTLGTSGASPLVWDRFLHGLESHQGRRLQIKWSDAFLSLFLVHLLESSISQSALTTSMKQVLTFVSDFCVINTTL